MRKTVLILLLLIASVLTLTGFVLREEALKGRDHAKSALAVLFGDGRRLFANHFLSKADAYFHRGRYPSIFEAADRESNHLVESLAEPPAVGEDGHDHDLDDHHAHDEACAHANPAQGPDDWIARLARRFEPEGHVHLTGDEEREMLPWIKLAVEMDPHNVAAYTVGGYWLREMGRTNEAKAFLRDGQRNNPDSSEIYFELGRLEEMEGQNPEKVLRLYELALESWRTTNANAPEPDTLALGRIVGRMGHVEENRGRLDAALRHYTLLEAVSPNPDSVRELIDSVRERMLQTNSVSQPF